MSRETIIPGADGSEIVVRSLLPGLQRYPLQVRRQDRDHPKLPREGIHLHEAELPAVIRALAEGDAVIRLSRAQIPALSEVVYSARGPLTEIAGDANCDEEERQDANDVLAALLAAQEATDGPPVVP